MAAGIPTYQSQTPDLTFFVQSDETGQTMSETAATSAPNILDPISVSGFQVVEIASNQLRLGDAQPVNASNPNGGTEFVPKVTNDTQAASDLLAQLGLAANANSGARTLFVIDGGIRLPQGLFQDRQERRARTDN